MIKLPSKTKYMIPLEIMERLTRRHFPTDLNYFIYWDAKLCLYCFCYRGTKSWYHPHAINCFVSLCGLCDLFVVAVIGYSKKVELVSIQKTLVSHALECRGVFLTSGTHTVSLLKCSKVQLLAYCIAFGKSHSLLCISITYHNLFKTWPQFHTSYMMTQGQIPFIEEARDMVKSSRSDE